MFPFAARIAFASSSIPGAITTSTKTSAIARAAAASSRRFAATIPPKALVGSQARAAAWASARLVAVATPQGLACLMIATAGRSNSATSSKAASASPTLL